jgi:hypothetical protein
MTIFKALLAKLVVPLVVLSAVLVLGAAPALAALEAPRLELSSRGAEAVSVRGLLSPNSLNEEGTYEILYKKSATECAGGSHGAQGLALPGVEEQEASETFSGLEPGSTYTFCLVDTNTVPPHEKVSSPLLTVTTAIKPEAPIDVKARSGSLTSTSVEVEGELNPLKARESEPGTFEVVYKVSPVSEAPTGECEESATSEPASGAKEEKVLTKLENLQPNAKYTFCLRARNGATPEGETAVSAPVAFTTPVAPPTILAERVPEPTATEATLVAEINPNNQTTTYSFQYATNEALTGATTLNGASPLEGYGELRAAVETGPVLAPGATYYYRAIAKNAKGEEKIGPVDHFETTPEAPETIAPAAGIAEIGSTTATLHGVLNPHAAATDGWYFAYDGFNGPQHGNSCVQESGNEPEAPTTPLEPEADVQAKAVSASLTGLAPDTEYRVCLVTRDKAGTKILGNQISFKTAGFSNVGSSSATLHAQIAPGGLSTSYFFEYGPTAAYGSTTSVQSAGAGSGVVSVQANLEGLTADTTYHFRAVVVTSTNGTTRGGDGMFSTFPAGQLGLPDARGYELVSSLSNGDASVVPEGGGSAAGDGSSVAYSGQASLVGGNGSSEFHGNGTGGVTGGFNQYLARRGVGGWSSADIQPDGSRSPQFKGFTSDLSFGLLSSEVPLVEGAPSGQASLYSRETATGSYQLLGANATYDGSTPNGSEILLSHGGNLYLRASSGRESPVNVLPGGAGLAQGSTFGGPSGPDLSNAISVDGSRVFWSEEEPAGKTPLRLFVSENVGQPGQQTVQVDADQGGPDTAGGGGLFWTASSDGSRVFFTDCNRLTKGSTAVESTNCEHEVQEGPVSGEVPYGSDLYEYDTETGVLADLTADAVNPGEPANVVGVLGTSEDGSYVYFAAGGSLADSGATPRACSQPFEEQLKALNEAIKCNVYVEHEGKTRFVAAVTNYDGEAGIANYLHGRGDWTRSVGVHSSFVSPDGRHLVFESVEDLTGFDSLGDQELYMYDDPGGLTCVSCNPSGAPTVHDGPYEFDQELPISGSATVALRDLSVDGNRAFFTTTEGLVPGDRNGQQDVYEWERPGEGTCTAQTATPLDNGCLYDLSGGTSTDESDFLDASETGDDVFIETRAQLVPQDHTELFEVFDARVGAVTEPTPSTCTGTGCQGVPGAPPIFATPSSVTFNGIGNFPAPVLVAPKKTTKKVKCAKPRKLSKGRCVKPKVKAKRKGKGKGKGKGKAGKSSASSARRHGSALWVDPPSGVKLSTVGNYAAGAVQG